MKRNKAGGVDQNEAKHVLKGIRTDGTHEKRSRVGCMAGWMMHSAKVLALTSQEFLKGADDVFANDGYRLPDSFWPMFFYRVHRPPTDSGLATPQVLVFDGKE